MQELTRFLKNRKENEKEFVTFFEKHTQYWKREVFKDLLTQFDLFQNLLTKFDLLQADLRYYRLELTSRSLLAEATKQDWLEATALVAKLKKQLSLEKKEKAKFKRGLKKLAYQVSGSLLLDDKLANDWNILNTASRKAFKLLDKKEPKNGRKSKTNNKTKLQRVPKRYIL